MSYIIGTGYFNGNERKEELEWFAKLWLQNTLTWIDRLPERIVCVSVGRSNPPYRRLVKELETDIQFDVIDLPGNPGHVHQLIGKLLPAKPYDYGGVTGTFITLAGIAFLNECDLVYKEQDCLAFGQWVFQLYEELGPTKWGMMFGKTKAVCSAQSIFIVKHWFLLDFIRCLITYGSEREPANLPEEKFSAMMREYPETVKQFSFGYDRDRPFNVKDPVFYFQKATPDELLAVEAAGLIELPRPIPKALCFSNDLTDRFK